MGILGRLFGRGPSQPKDEGIYFYVRCNNCGRVLHTRLDPERELTARESGEYEVHKEMMDDRCFRRIHLIATFDHSRRPINVEILGGTQIDRATWEAEKDLPRRPAAESDTDL